MSSVSLRLWWWCWLGLCAIVFITASVESCSQTCGFPEVSQRLRRMTPFVEQRQSTSVSSGSTSCSTNCTVQPHLPCTITSSVSCDGSYEPATPTADMPGPPEGLTITLSYNTSNFRYTDVLVEFSVPQGTYMNLDGFIVQETALQGESGNTHQDQCHHFDLTQAKWTDSDSQTTFQESCGSFEESAFYMVTVQSTPRSADDGNKQEALVSIKPRYKDNALPDRMRLMIVIYADSCSRTVRVAFLQAPDADQFQQYGVRLMPQSEYFPCSCTTVSHINGQEMQEAVFNDVPTGTYFAQVQGESTTSCPNHCLATNSADFSIVEDPPHCIPDVPAFETTAEPEEVPTTEMTSTADTTPKEALPTSSTTTTLVAGLGTALAVVALVVGAVVYKCLRQQKKEPVPGQPQQYQGPKVCIMYPDDPRVDVDSLLGRLPGKVERMVVEANKPIVKTERTLVDWLNIALYDRRTPVIIVCPAVFAQSAESIFNPEAAAAAAAAAEDSGSRPEDAEIAVQPHLEQPPVDVAEEEPIITACRHIKELVQGQNSEEFKKRLRLVSFEIEPVLHETDDSASTTQPKTTPSTNQLSDRHQSSMLFSLPDDIDQLVNHVSQIQSINNNNLPSAQTEPSMFTVDSEADRYSPPKYIDSGTIATTESMQPILDHICNPGHLCNYRTCPSPDYLNGMSDPVLYLDNDLTGREQGAMEESAGYNAGYSNPDYVQVRLFGGEQVGEGDYNAEANLQEPNLPEMDNTMSESSSQEPFHISSNREIYI